MEQRQHPAHPREELALQLSCGHQLPNDTGKSIVERADLFEDFLRRHAESRASE